MEQVQKKQAYALLQANPRLLDFLGVYPFYEYELFREFKVSRDDGKLMVEYLLCFANNISDTVFWSISDKLGFELCPRQYVLRERKMRIAIFLFRKNEKRKINRKQNIIRYESCRIVQQSNS